MNLLNKRLIDEIRSHLLDMEWAPREYESDKLKLLLKGAELALYDKDIMFSLHSFEENYRTVFYVSVKTYNDPMNEWNGKKEIGRIYSYRTEEYWQT